MDPTNSVTRLFADALPDWEQLPPSCGIRAGMPDGWAHHTERDLVAAVDRGGGRMDFILELQRVHPMDREHRREHDDGFWRAFNEGAAFAWAQDIGRLGSPRFVPFDPNGPGAPDLRVDETDLWIEVKAIGLSEEDQAEEDRLFARTNAWDIPMRVGNASRHVPAGLVNKFSGDLADAEKKLARQDGGRLLIFISLAIDFGVSRDFVRNWVAEWADAVVRQRGHGVVVCDRFEWHRPFVVAGIG